MQDDTREMFSFKCSSCGDAGEVPFKPERDLLCRECMQAEREIRKRKAPRRRHGTRVSVPITCVECGKDEMLDYIPKGRKLTECMCTECAATALGKRSNWSKVRDQKRREDRNDWYVNCDECGVKLMLAMHPDPEKEYYCVSCEYDHSPAGENALRDSEHLAHGVHKRK